MLSVLAAFRLSRDHGVRFADGAGFVAGVFQAFVGDFRPKLFEFLRCGLVRLARSSGLQTSAPASQRGLTMLADG
jgi:hypothetical protein